MTDANARPQDVGRPHKRRGTPTPETQAVLDRYRAAMRAELDRLLDELEAVAEDTGQVAGQLTIDGTDPEPKRTPALGIVGRRERWDLAIRLGRELAAAPEEPWAGDPMPGRPGKPKPARAPRLSARDRAALTT